MSGLLTDFKYSLPLYPGLDSLDINERLIPFLLEVKDLLFDIYFTLRIPPFEQDAMGTIFDKDDIKLLIAQALLIHNETGIPISATFNNNSISPSFENYKLFVKHFKPYYDLGIHTITIPFKSWLSFGLKEEFPKLFVKNTILENIREPFQLANAYMYGFDYVNVDRSLMRNQNRLKELHDTKTKMEIKLDKKLYLSLLINESCTGNCPLQSEHFLYNTTRTDKLDVFFKSSFNNIACKSDIRFFNNKLKIANFINDDNWLSGLKVIDVFKLHGRENRIVFENSLSLLSYIKNKTPYIDDFKNLVPLSSWGEFIDKTKNCNFDCWDCDFCDSLSKY